LHGRILTPDGLRVICVGLDNDPEKIGIPILETLAMFRNERNKEWKLPVVGNEAESRELFLP